MAGKVLQEGEWSDEEEREKFYDVNGNVRPLMARGPVSLTPKPDSKSPIDDAELQHWKDRALKAEEEVQVLNGRVKRRDNSIQNLTENLKSLVEKVRLERQEHEANILQLEARATFAEEKLKKLVIAVQREKEKEKAGH